MKSCILFFLVLSCLQTSLAQSKRKKENEFLVRQLEERSENYDSLKYVFYVDLYEFEDGIKKTCQSLLTTFSIRENQINRLERDIKVYQSKLMRLKEPFSTMRALELPETKIKRDLERDLSSFDPMYVEIAQKSIPDKRRKIQNEFLRKRIHTYDSISHLNEQIIRNMYLFKEGLRLLIPTLLEKQRLYDEHITYLEKENTDLINQLNKLYDKYIKKGPEIFPDEYNEVFSGGRITNDSIESYEEPALYCIDREEAEFPGGMQNLKYYVSKHYHVPEIALELGLEGKAWVRFTIKEDGSVSDVIVVKGITDCRECDQEAIRIVKQMPYWRPAMRNGRAVKTVWKMPVEIKLN